MPHTRTAYLSPDGVYRYSLHRAWGEGRYRRALFCMVNPSTADATTDDPTVAKCRYYAAREDCGSLTIVNLYAYRSPDPAVLANLGDAAIGPENDLHISAALNEVWDGRGNPLIVAAWGAAPGAIAGGSFRAADVFKLLDTAAGPGGVRCLGMTQAGWPAHPLYRPARQPLIRYRGFGRSDRAEAAE